MRRSLLVGAVATLLAASGCSVAQRANGTAPAPVAPAAVVPTVIAPPQAEGLDGTSGAPGPQVCTAITRTLTARFRGPVTAKPYAWNDGGLPAMDLCTLLLGDRPVTIGVSALPVQPDTLSRLVENPGSVDSLPELGPDATISESRIVFQVADRAVRIMPAGGIDRDPADGIERARAVAIALAVRAAVPKQLRPARQADPTCQLSTAAAERFVQLQVQLRRDYRVRGALTCIWGTFDATVSIVEAFNQSTIPEADRVPAPVFAPLGQPGYYLPDAGELVFRQGKRVVRVTALTNPPREVTLDALTTIVDPLLPLFIR
ncbi:hypothetical protein GCM10009630_26860 [Kribbella jejuensis]|uniref:DUF5642 domain-containing protein n=1 Tax=Kribbella jejuensis TaxID=236068 RepID=A0A542DUI4_9ACTN|nr:hypothetical protein [Kribbella jejuensis]TQJ06757.1 hypothetical protein FB475_6425 [Kribbella jejuensis]